MRESDFFDSLMRDRSITSKQAIATRITNAKKAEALLKKSLDIVVSNDNNMFDALNYLHTVDDLAHAPLQNALRKYYAFVRGKEFPKIKDYLRSKKGESDL